MKILIVEDEELAAERLAQLVKEIEPDAMISGPIDTVVAAIAHLKTNPVYDLILLDIQLADGKSFSIFEDFEIVTPVIFTTAYDEYALQAFELNSIDYLLKPVNREKLKSSLGKFRKLKEYYGAGNPNNQLYEMIRNLKTPEKSSYKDRFLISKGDAMVPVKISEIACFYAEDKEVFLLTHDNKRHIIPHTIEELSEKLDPKLFFRVNRQFIVSSEAVYKVHNYFNFKLKVEIKAYPKLEIIVSRPKVSAFKAWMNGEVI
ncbi:MAG: LytTR family DNA-binding domain-containing protein [Bacteroidales bacterium]|nr:LytTR family DNA-binding domain-containing protein [Bacteroidales bacterium]